MSEPADGDNVQRLVSDPTPDETSPATFPATDTPALGPDADAGTTRALAAFLTITPFLDLHEKAGNAEQHRARGGLCFTLDLFVRAAAIMLLLSLIAAVAWKVIAPLPPFDRPFSEQSAGTQP